MSVFSVFAEIDYTISKNLIEWTSETRPIQLIMRAGTQNDLVKGAVPAAIFWYLWFRDGHQSVKRSQLVATLLTSVFAIIVGRGLASILPFRSRPLGTEEVMGADTKQSAFLDNWSSMPSDHAIMFFTLAGCIFLISQREGILLFLHAAFFVCAARVMLGMHYLTDVIVGAIVGLTIALALMPILTRFIQQKCDKPQWSLRPEIGYPLLFLVTFQFATMFNAARGLVGKMLDLLI